MNGQINMAQNNDARLLFVDGICRGCVIDVGLGMGIGWKVHGLNSYKEGLVYDAFVDAMRDCLDWVLKASAKDAVIAWSFIW